MGGFFCAEAWRSNAERLRRVNVNLSHPARELPSKSVILMEDGDVDAGGTDALLAKSRRLVLLSRNLLRVLARRIDIAEQLKTRTVQPVGVHRGHHGAMRGSAGGE